MLQTCLAVLLLAFADTVVAKSWKQKLCSHPQYKELCPYFDFFDERLLDWEKARLFVCLPWKAGNHPDICEEEDMEAALGYLEHGVKKIVCSGMSKHECALKWAGPRQAAEILGKYAANTAGAAATQAQVETAATAAREAAKQAALLAGKSPASAAQFGRHAATRAANEAAKGLGVEVSRVTSKGGVELASTGVTGATSELASAVVGPAVGGVINAGFEVYESGLSAKAAAKFASGTAGNVAGMAAGTVCGPFLWLCGPAFSVLATRALDSFVVDQTFDNDIASASDYADAVSRVNEDADTLLVLLDLALQKKVHGRDLLLAYLKPKEELLQLEG